MLAPKDIAHGLRVTLDGADDYDAGTWHVLDRSPNGTRAAWYVHRWQDVPEFDDYGQRTGTRTIWRTLTVEPKQMSHASRLRCSEDDPMLYPAQTEAETETKTAACPNCAQHSAYSGAVVWCACSGWITA